MHSNGNRLNVYESSLTNHVVNVWKTTVDSLPCWKFCQWIPWIVSTFLSSFTCAIHCPCLETPQAWPDLLALFLSKLPWSLILSESFALLVTTSPLLAVHCGRPSIGGVYFVVHWLVSLFTQGKACRLFMKRKPLNWDWMVDLFTRIWKAVWAVAKEYVMGCYGKISFQWPLLLSYYDFFMIPRFGDLVRSSSRH